MSVITIGALRHRVTVEQPVQVDDGGGGVTESWSALATVWADLKTRNGQERLEADRVSGRLTHEVMMRYRVDVQPQMRLRFGTRIFHILAVIDLNARHQWLRCLCEERDL